MTQLIAFQFRGGVFLAADRRTTRVTPRIRLHDPNANKTVVALLRDGVVGVAYTGDAYIGDMPTDEWIAFTIFEMLHPGQEFPRDNFIAGCEVDKVPTIRMVMKDLTRRLESTGKNIAILVVGIGGADDRAYSQVVWRWSSAAPRKPYGDLRFKRLFRRRLLAAGQLAEREVAPMFDRIVLEARPKSPHEVADCLTRCIREIGGKNAGVGQDVAVTWFEPKLVSALFSPSSDWRPPPLAADISLTGSANATPWVVAPGLVSCPHLSQAKTQINHGEWAFDFLTTASLPTSGRVDVLAQPRMDIRQRLKSSELYTSFSYRPREWKL